MYSLFELPPTVTKYEIAKNELHNAYQILGYRPSDQPWRNYVLSVFQANNQSINVWTHFIPFLLTIHQFITLSTTLDLLGNPHMRPLGAALVAFATLFLASSVAHCFCDKSELVHFVCFFVDYCAVGVFGMGASLLNHNYFVKDKDLAYFLDLSFPVGVIINIMVAFVICFTKVMFGERQRGTSTALMIAVVGVSYVWFQIPVIHQAVTGHRDATLHVFHTMGFLACGFFYATHIPERWFPETFDIVGNSHQLFHLCLFFSCRTLVRTTVEEIQKGMYQEKSGVSPSFLRTYGSLVVIGVVDVVLLISFYQWVSQKLSDDNNNNKNK